MFVRKVAVSRRAVLRGIGTAIALPLLDAMVPALTAAPKSVRRFGAVYVPNGIAMGSWTPAAEGAGFALSPILSPLARFRERLLVFTGVDGQKGGGGHTSASTKFLTGWPGKMNEDGLQAGVSIDQYMAREFGKVTQLGSLELSLEPADLAGTCDVTSCAFIHSLSWSSPTTQLPTEHNPRVVFERLFGDPVSADPAARRRLLEKEKSLLDSVTDSLHALTRSLGVSDRTRVDEYFTAIRGAERRIQNAEAKSAMELPAMSQLAGVPQEFEDHFNLMTDLQVLAFRADLTRVITFMVGREYSGRTYPQLGIFEPHHPLSHHLNDPAKIAGNVKVNTYHMQMFASYLEKLDAVPDGDGSLLDHMLMMYGCGMSDSNLHNQDNLPILLLGGREYFDGGRHLKYAKEPLANLLLTSLDKLGIPVDQLANSSATLSLGGRAA